jgi:predicted nucleotidyltransferase
MREQDAGGVCTSILADGRDLPLLPGLPLDQIVADLSRVDGMVAVVLGGSWASGRQRPDSDVDLGVCYRAERPLDVRGVRELARRLSDTPDPVVTEIGVWGQWVNGGAWLTIKGQRVDFIYRDVDFMIGAIDEWLAGRGHSDYWQQAPYGFHSQIYCAEARCWYALWDPERIVAALKAKVAVYPSVRKQSGIDGWLWGAGFTLEGVKHTPERGEAYLVAGYLMRAATEMIQVLYALNETYFMNDKYVYRDLAEFNLVPKDFMTRVDALMGGDNSPADLRRRVELAAKLREEVLTLVGDSYTPRF